jgi:hypothetical protein
VGSGSKIGAAVREEIMPVLRRVRRSPEKPESSLAFISEVRQPADELTCDHTSHSLAP